MRRVLPACLAGLLLIAANACTPFPGTLEQPSCEDLFADLDRVQRVYGADTLRLGLDDRAISFPALNRPVRMLRSQGCITRVDDLASIEQVTASLQPFERVTGGEAVPRQSVHVGVIDGFTGLSLANRYFGLLGYRSRSVGVDGLGRRYYIGAFTSAAEVAQAIDVAREAGFAFAYATEYPRF
jgi:hypothetical protein